MLILRRLEHFVNDASVHVPLEADVARHLGPLVVVGVVLVDVDAAGGEEKYPGVKFQSVVPISDLSDLTFPPP